MKKGMEESYVEDLASHDGPDHALATREGAARRWCRGAGRPAIAASKWALSGCRRAVDQRKAIPVAAFSRAVIGSRGVEEPVHARDLLMLRTGRSHGHPPVVMEGAGRAGNADGGNPVMDDREKSDGLVVAAKRPNNAQGGAAEAVEGSGPAKGNTTGKTRPGHGVGQGALSGLGRVRRVAATDKDARFTALLAPCRCRPPEGGVPGACAEGGAWGGRGHVDGLRRGSRSEPS